MIIEFKKKYLSKSPTYLLDHGKIVSPSFLLLILISLFFIDKPFALYCLSLPTQVKELFLLIERLFCPFFWILALPSFFFYVRFVLRQERKSRKFWFISLSLPLSVFAAKILELLFGRSNPEWLSLHQEIVFRFFEWNPSFHSFPSLSACTITAFATALSCLIPKARFSIFFGGLLLSLAPIFASSCFLSDALAGMCLGAFLTQWIFKKFRKEVSL